MLWAFVAVACIARFIHLDSDPKFESWIGYVTDEGRWIETARNLALFGDLRLYGISQLHLVLSPGFQAVNYVVFELGGVSFWSARIWSASCGAAVLIFSFLLLRRHASGLPLYLGLAVLAFEPLTLSLSRTALPEVPSLLFTLLAFIAICTWQRRVIGAAFGGLFMAVAISMKGTTMMMAPVFLLMVALSGVPESGRQRLLRCSAFLLGMLVPAMIGFALVLAAGIIKPEALPRFSAGLLPFLELGSVYLLVARFFQGTVVVNVNMLLLGAWVCSWILMFRKEYRGTPLGDIYELSGIWSASWLIVWLSLFYTPQRYYVHVILPLTIHLVAGLSLWRTVGPARVLARVNDLRVRWGIAFLIWLVLPAALIVADSVMTLTGMTSGETGRLRYQLLAIIVITGVLAMLARAAHAGKGAVTGFIAFPVLAALLQMTIEQAGAIDLSRSAAGRVLPVVNLAMLGGVAGYCLARSQSIAGLIERASAKTLLSSLALVGLLCQDAPTLLQPTYSIRDASRTTARLFPDAVLLQSSAAGSLLLETRIPYRDMVSHDTVVDGILNFDRDFKPGPEFVLVTTYRVLVHPRDNFARRRMKMESPGVVLLDVYRNEQPQRRSVAPPPNRE